MVCVTVCACVCVCLPSPPPVPQAEMMTLMAAKDHAEQLLDDERDGRAAERAARIAAETAARDAAAKNTGRGRSSERRLLEEEVSLCVYMCVSERERSVCVGCMFI